MNNDQNINNTNNVNVVFNNTINNPMMNNVPKKSNLWLIIGGLFLILIVVIIVLSATGVLGGNVLTCVSSVEKYGMIEDDEIRIYYDDSDHPTKMIITMKTKFTEDSNFTVDSMKDAFESKVEDMKEFGANVSIVSDENSLTYTITIGNDDVGAYFEMMDSSYDSLKNFYEKRGFTCN